MTKNRSYVMAENTNDIWVLSVMEGPEVYVKKQKRKNYLVMVYDIRSRYIFYIKYHYLVSKSCRREVIRQVMEQSGIPYYLICEEKYKSGLECLGHDFGITFRTMECLGWKELNVCNQMEHYFRVMQERMYPQNPIYKNHQIALVSRKKWNQYRLGREEAPVLFYQKQRGMHALFDKEVYWHSFLAKTKRKVDGCGKVVILSKMYQVPDCYVGEELIFRIDPYNSEEIYIYDEERNWRLHACPLLEPVRNENSQCAII